MKRSHPRSAENAVKAMVDAAKGPLAVPGCVALRDCDLPFWDGILRARARDEWTEVDLVVAAQLARCQADIERESEALEGEGTIGINDRGTSVMNPRVTVLERMTQREMALMRTLRMGGKAAGDPRNELGRRKLQRESEALRDELADEELLAT